MSKTNGSILVIDDDPDVLTAAHLLLKRHFTKVITEEGPDNLPQLLAQENWDVILLDMNFELGANSGQEGLQWLEKIQTAHPSTPVIMMTAYGAVDTAVNAMKKGAADFVLKPWQNERLLATVNSALRLKHSQEEVQYLRKREKEIQPGPETPLLGVSPAMLNIHTMIERVAPSDANVLILGENGSGKEVIAHEIYNLSSRKDEVLVTVDLGSVPETLFESELFGHKKGAFTGADKDRIGRFQAASGGTLFLDEVGNLPLHLQGKLLTALEQRQVIPLGSNQPVSIDVRLVCATNKNLKYMIQQGEFREDLLYRMNTVEIHIPPLRERQPDIPLLVEHFSKTYAEKYHVSTPTISEETLDSIKAYAWPGNIRELRHAVERAIVMGNSSSLEAEELLMNRQTVSSNKSANNTFENLNLDAIESKTIDQALRSHGGNISHAAKALGITRTSLYRRMEKYGL